MAHGVLISDVITDIDQVGPSIYTYSIFNYLGPNLAHYLVYKNIHLNIY